MSLSIGCWWLDCAYPVLRRPLSSSLCLSKLDLKTQLLRDSPFGYNLLSHSLAWNDFTSHDFTHEKLRQLIQSAHTLDVATKDIDHRYSTTGWFCWWDSHSQELDLASLHSSNCSAHAVCWVLPNTAEKLAFRIVPSWELRQVKLLTACHV